MRPQSIIKVLPNIERMKGPRNVINTPNIMQRQSRPLSSDYIRAEVKVVDNATRGNDSMIKTKKRK